MSTIAAIAAGFFILLILMYLFQDRLLFMPASGMLQTPESAGLKAEDVWTETEDGVRIHGWYFPNEETNRVIVLSHGNAGNISYRIEIARTLLDSGAAVLMYDYRGYGKSEGRPSEQGLYRDILAFTEALMDEKGYESENIFHNGRSLGGAVAAYAATQIRPGGLVLDSAFTNLRKMAGDVYPFVPSALVKYSFPTEEYLSRLQGVPVMIMHSPQDEIIPIHHSERLFEAAGEPKRFVRLRGGHNENFYASRELIEESWREFMNSANPQD
ncbi:alpha/beta hydrolase [Rhodohalobacter mucosus]|nr:alpha/beta hydrolase [Rhodohalobacter mucosus]